MPPDVTTAADGRVMRLSERLGDLDDQLYLRLSAPTVPWLDNGVSHLTNAADHSKLSIGMSIALALTGPRGRRAAIVGVASMAATSAIANLLVKPLARRRRPSRAHSHPNDPAESPYYVVMPESHSFPSGHSAAAMAFATGVASVWPAAAAAPFAVAGAVGYSRVHTGVHFPGDVALGWVLGAAIGRGVGGLDRWNRSR